MKAKRKVIEKKKYMKIIDEMYLPAWETEAD